MNANKLRPNTFWIMPHENTLNVTHIMISLKCDPLKAYWQTIKTEI